VKSFLGAFNVHWYSVMASSQGPNTLCRYEQVSR